MQTNKIQMVIFDMDGVIIDSEPIHLKIEQQLFNMLGVNIPKKKHESFIGMSSINMWSDIICQNDIHQPVQNIISEKQKLFRSHLKNNNIVPIKGIKEMIERLHKNEIKLSVASSSSMADIHLILNKLNLSDFFDFYISGANLKKSKPHPEIFLLTSRKANVPSESCCVIEDSQNGVKAAKAAKMKCIGYQNPNSGNQNLNLADIVISDFEKKDILQVLKQIAQ